MSVDIRPLTGAVMLWSVRSRELRIRSTHICPYGVRKQSFRFVRPTGSYGVRKRSFRFVRVTGCYGVRKQKFRFVRLTGCYGVRKQSFRFVRLTGYRATSAL